MPMNYSSLIAPKGTPGSIMNWVSYSKLDVGTVVDEAQSLIFTTLRVREMETELTFQLLEGRSRLRLPARFLDPIGDIYDITNGFYVKHRTKQAVQEGRVYEPYSGTLDPNPVVIAANSNFVTYLATAHGLSQGSVVNISGLTSLVANIAPNGTFSVFGIPTPDQFNVQIDDRGSVAATGGGTGGVFSGQRLLDGVPTKWDIWDGEIKFDCAAEDSANYKLMYYRAPELLSTVNPSNWLTDRYPALMRKACQAAAADYMKDTNEYTKNVQALNNLVNAIAIKDDLKYSGMEFGTDTP